MLIKLLAWITGGMPVVLEDFRGETYRTVAYVSKFGKVWCHVYPITRVGFAVLKPDGSVAPGQTSSYITRWKEVRKR